MGSPEASVPPALAAALSGRYSIVRELGRGGMARVYLVHDVKHDRDVALKVLRPDLTAAIGSDRFEREIRITSQLSHPHILPVFDSGQTDSLLWYTMPYVEGESLRGLLDRERQLPQLEAIRIASAVAGALEYAHRKGVVHRDIKPENILLQNGEVLLADFGIAQAAINAGDERLTATGLSIGTPAYIAPEQASGERAVDRRADIYSLGCVVFEMLAGEAPYTGPTPQAIIAKRFSAPVPSVRHGRPDVSATVDAIVRRAMALTPADRFEDATSLLRALSAPGVSVVEPKDVELKRARSRRALAYGAVALACAAIGLIMIRGKPMRAGGPALQRVAVLAFLDTGPGADSTFTSGLSHEIATKLGALDNVVVLDQTGNAAAPRDDSNQLRLGQKLHANFILTGRVRWAEAAPTRRIRVTPQLFDVTTGRQLWSDGLEVDIADVFQVQATIATRVAKAIGTTITGKRESILRTAPTSSLEAYSAYLRGRSADYRDSPEALAAYEDAIRLDPGFAEAHARAAWQHMQHFSWGRDRSPRRGEWARSALDRALGLKPDLGITHRFLARYFMEFERNLDSASLHLDESERIDGPTPGVYTMRALLAHASGNEDSTIGFFQRALAMEPGNIEHLVNVARAAGMHRKYPMAIAYLDTALSRDPDRSYIWAWRVFASLLVGDTADAQSRLDAAVRRFGLTTMATEPPTSAYLRYQTRYSEQLQRVTRSETRLDTVDFYLWQAQLASARREANAARLWADSAFPVILRRLEIWPDERGHYEHLAWAYALSGNRSAALLAAAQHAKLSAGSRLHEEESTQTLAEICVVVEDFDCAFDAIEKILRRPGFLSVRMLETDPRWASLRHHRRFPELRARFPR